MCSSERIGAIEGRIIGQQSQKGDTFVTNVHHAVRHHSRFIVFFIQSQARYQIRHVAIDPHKVGLSYPLPQGVRGHIGFVVPQAHVGDTDGIQAIHHGVSIIQTGQDGRRQKVTGTNDLADVRAVGRIGVDQCL